SRPSDIRRRCSTRSARGPWCLGPLSRREDRELPCNAGCIARFDRPHRTCRRRDACVRALHAEGPAHRMARLVAAPLPQALRHVRPRSLLLMGEIPGTTEWRLRVLYVKILVKHDRERTTGGGVTSLGVHSSAGYRRHMIARSPFRIAM